MRKKGLGEVHNVGLEVIRVTIPDDQRLGDGMFDDEGWQLEK